MAAMSQQVGFSQRLQIQWLEYTAQLVAAGRTRPEINAALQENLQDKLSIGHQVQRGNREKTITILLRIWADPAPHVVPLRDAGIEWLKRVPAKQHLALHWGLSMAAYPFFAGVAGVLGKLLRLQETVGTAQIQRRIREQLGERATVERAARRVYRSYIDWGVIHETEIKGVYRKAAPQRLDDRALAGWLLQCVLHADPSEWTALDALNKHISLFPFKISSDGIDALRQCEHIEIMRHGLDQEMVRLHR